MPHHILISGASTGIGFATAQFLQKKGFTVLGGVRKPEDGALLEQEIGCDSCILDVTKEDDIAGAANLMAQRTASGDKISLLNNAGIAIGGPLECVAMDEIRQQLDVNVIGLIALTQAMLPQIRETKGRIVNMGSIAGRLASPFLGPYAASKFAVEAVTDSLRREMMPFGVEVISINPGVIKTPIWDKSMTPLADKYLDDSFVAAAPYRKMMEAAKTIIEDSIKGGAEPIAVAKAVHRGLTARKPKTRYYVGKGVGVTAMVTRVVPDREIDKVAARRFE